MGITWEEAEVAAQNRSEWRQRLRVWPNASAWMWVEVKDEAHAPPVKQFKCPDVIKTI